MGLTSYWRCVRYNSRPMNRVRNSLLLLLLLTSTWGCASLPENIDRPVSYAFPDTSDTALGVGSREEIRAHPGESGALVLGRGLDAFVARAVLARAAERSIDLQYYLYHDDLIGHLLTAELIRAAERGVRVRLLVDDMSIGDRDLGAAVLASHPNIEVRLFNPFARNGSKLLQLLTRFGSVTRRMHCKSFTVDNQAAILGGRNIGEEYFEVDEHLAFTDLDVLCIGPVVKEVSSFFDLYWNSDLAYPAESLRDTPPAPKAIAAARRAHDEFVRGVQDSPYLEALRHSKLANDLRGDSVRFAWGPADLVYDRPEKLKDDPDDEEHHLLPQVSPYFEEVQEELIIISPYFIPGTGGTEFLTSLVKRGVRVRVLTNSLASNDVGIVHAGYAKYREALLRGGVEIYEMRRQLSDRQRKSSGGAFGSSNSSLHAKAFVFDRKKTFIGSLNLDPRAVVQNTEVGVVLTSKEIGVAMGEWFDQNMDQIAFRLELKKNYYGSERILWHGLHEGKPRTWYADPYAGFLKRFSLAVLGLLPIEDQL